jgi:phosphatidylglycerol:prolipoprotein diacylglycerol transferase
MFHAGFSLPLSILAQIQWNPDPIIFQLGPLPLRWYSLGWLLAFGIGFYIVRWIYLKEGKPEKDLESILFAMMLGAMIGARLGHVLFYRPGYFLANPIEIIAVWKGIRGLASHGGTLGIFLALFLYARKRPDQPYLWLMDRVAIPTALGAMFIRLGNLMNSEILGLPSDAPWAMVFTRIDALPRHPAQLYEAIAYFFIFIILLTLYRRRGTSIPHGTLIGIFMTLAFSARFLIEFVKERHVPFEVGLPLSMGQILSIPMGLAGMALFWWAQKRGAPD